MKKVKISLIAAIGQNRVIGRDNKIPWHISEDLKRFKKLTSGHAVVMGRKTYESIGKPLPGRTNIIVTRDTKYQIPTVPPDLAQSTKILVFLSLESALDEAKKIENRVGGEVFVLGGGEVFRQTLPLADKLYLTIVKGKFQGPILFPIYEHLFKKIVYREDREGDGYKYTFVDLER